MAFSRLGAAFALGSLLLAFAAPRAVFAVEAELKLVLAPVGQPGPYFDLVLDPGDTIRLEVTLGNDGSAAVSARTYATDVFTITNGGYGGRLRDAVQSGTTTWLTYPTAVVDLQPGSRVQRPLTVSVPAEATPGEYISSLVVESDAPVSGEGGVALDQVVRQAIAVVITVPGLREPELGLGEAHHEVVAGRSFVSIDVHNTGNVRLKPAVEFVLRDASGTELSRSAFQMDTFFARTDTLVAVSLASLLPPGSYTIELALSDAEQGVAASGVIPLVVGATPAAASGGVDGPGLTLIGPGGMSELLALALAGVALAPVVVGLSVLRLRNHRRPSESAV